MDKSIYLIGMARNGTYALVNWILGQGWPSKIKFHDRKSYDKYFGQILPGCNLYRYERNNLRTFQESMHQKVKQPRKKVLLYLIRDPYNHFASSLKLWTSFPPAKRQKVLRNIDRWSETLVSGWKQYAAQALNKANYLPKTAVYVDYNQWFASKRYRQGMSKRLGCEFSDDPLEQVRSFPNPKQKLVSSFDKQKYNGRAQSMKVLDRWRHYKDNPIYRNMFDKEVIDYATRLFFPPPFEL